MNYRIKSPRCRFTLEEVYLHPVMGRNVKARLQEYVILQEPIFKDPQGGLGQRNAWFSGDIEVREVHRRTARAVDERLFQTVAPGQNSRLLDTVLHALEFDDYCQFEVCVFVCACVSACM